MLIVQDDMDKRARELEPPINIFSKPLIISNIKMLLYLPNTHSTSPASLSNNWGTHPRTTGWSIKERRTAAVHGINQE